MLYIWTGADAKDIKNSMGPTLTEQRVPHRFVPNMTCFPQSASSEDVVLVCGAKAVELLVSFGVLPKNRTVNSLRERMFSYQGVRFFVTFDPGLVNRDYARLSDIIWDLMLVCRLITTGSLAPVIGTYRYVESLHELIEYVEAKYEATGKAVDLACDLETKSLVPQVPDAWIIACSFTVEVGKSDVLYFDKGEAPVCPPAGLAEESMDYWQGLWCQINWLLTTPKVSLRGANFKYDENWLVEKWGILPTNQKFDTVLAGSLLDENRSNSLKLHAKLFTPMGGYEDDMDKYDFGCLEEVPKPEMLNYVGGDTDVTYRVAQHMKPQLLKDRALSNFYVKLLQPSAKVFAKMERTGVLIDQKIYADLKAELEGEIHRLSHEMLSMLPPKLRFRHHEKIEKALAEGKSPFIPSLMKEFFFSPYGMNLKPKMLTEKTKEASTSVDHLMMFEDDPEAKAFVEKFRELGSTTKTYSTYVVGFLKHLRPDGRFHPSYMLFKGEYGDKDDSGTDTGRCLTGDALILTDKGEIPINEVVLRGEQGESFKVLTHRNRWLPVTGFWRNGVKPVCRVLAEGRSLISTYNHPYMSFPSWTLAEDLKSGSWLYSIVSPPPVELWRPIAGWPFEVSNMGRVRRASSGKGVKAHALVAQRPKGKWGHLKVTLTRFVSGREKKDFPVHILVADAFLLTSGEEVAHLNGDASCNWVTNLKRVSVLENKLHARLHGTINRDSQKKLSWGVVDSIRAGVFGDDYTAAEALGVSRELVRDVRLFKRWTGRRDSMSGFMPVQVGSVSPAGVAETFDLTVEEDHSFVANGFVVHNTSAKDPAIQTLTKHNKWAKPLRRAYIAPPGYVILNVDFSQGELRIAAVLAEEPTMIKAYQNNMDLHSITAAQISGYEFEEFMLLPDDVRDELRSGGKAGNFGLLYGMQHLGFKDYAYYSYGVKMTEEEAFNRRQAFFELYSQLPVWHETQKNFAKLNGYVRSPLGRVRHLPLLRSSDREMRSKAERQSINSPVQSCLSDMMQLAMVHIDREYGHEDIHFCIMCHDAVTLYVPEADAVKWAKKIKEVMENLPLEKDFHWHSPLKFVADAEVGSSLESLKKLKGL